MGGGKQEMMQVRVIHPSFASIISLRKLPNETENKLLVVGNI